MLKKLDENDSESVNFSNFVNRTSEIEALNDLLITENYPLPVLMFYGVGGIGKSWLLRKFNESIKDLVPTALLDLGKNSGGEIFHQAPSLALTVIPYVST